MTLLDDATNVARMVRASSADAGTPDPAAAPLETAPRDNAFGVGEGELLTLTYPRPLPMRLDRWLVAQRPEQSRSRIQKFIDAKKLDAQKAITEEALVESGIIRRKLDGVRVLAKGDFSAKVDIEVTGASKSAVAMVEKAGGSLKVTNAPATE